MALLPTSALTLADLGMRLGPDNNLSPVINILSQANEIFDDMLWMEGNLPTGHRTTLAAGIPTANWRSLNGGVPFVRGQTVQITEACAMLEAFSRQDCKLVDMSGNPAAFRAQEDGLIIQGMGQQLATALFYGNISTNPAQFNGLAPRYPTVNTSTAPQAVNVIDAGGTGSTNTSVWIVGWGANSVTGIYPRNSVGGLVQEDLGRQRAFDGSGNPYMAYEKRYAWDCGISIRDWRYAVRIANVDVAALNAGTGPNLLRLLIRAINRLPVTGGAVGHTNQAGQMNGAGDVMPATRVSIYANRAVKTWLDIQQTEKTNAFLTIGTDAQGKPVTMFRGIPIRTVDALLSTEARVV